MHTKKPAAVSHFNIIGIAKKFFHIVVTATFHQSLLCQRSHQYQTGNWFYGGRLGIGIGGGYSFDPLGKRPGAETAEGCASSTTVGTFGDFGINVGPVQIPIEQFGGGVNLQTGKTYSEGPTLFGTASGGSGEGIDNKCPTESGIPFNFERPETKRINFRNRISIGVCVDPASSVSRVVWMVARRWSVVDQPNANGRCGA
jgi:hypothetical protein